MLTGKDRGVNTSVLASSTHDFGVLLFFVGIARVLLHAFTGGGFLILAAVLMVVSSVLGKKKGG